MSELDAFLFELLDRRGWSSRDIGDDGDLLESGALDSLALVEVIAFLDKRVVLGEDIEVDSFRTIAAIRELMGSLPVRP